MNALHLVFRTGRFNLSKVGDHFINPCCFGEDVAAWLGSKLVERGFQTRLPYQEDWGWELPATNGNSSCYLCMNGNSDGASANVDEGEWQIIVEKKRSIKQRLFGKGRITDDDTMVRIIEEILATDPAIREIRREK